MNEYHNGFRNEVEETQQLLELQKMLTDINKDNVKKVSVSIFNSSYSKNEVKFQELIHEIICIVMLFPETFQVIAELLYLLNNLIPKNLKLKEYLLQELHIPAFLILRKVSHFYLLKKCFQIGLFSFDDIKKFFDSYSFKSQEKFVLFMFFAKEFYNYDSSLYDSIIKGLKRPHLPSYEEEYLNNMDKYEKDNFKLLDELTEEGCTKDSLMYIIIHDDVDSLQEYSTNKSFNPNQTITSFFFPCEYIARKLSLIQICAFFRSVKCFKFLYLNGADLGQVANFAVAGGDLELVRIAEQNQKSGFVNSPIAAVEFRRNEIFDWLELTHYELIEEKEQSTFFAAVTKNNFYHFLYFLKKGYGVNDKGTLDRTPLHIAVAEGHLALIKYLVFKGSDVNALSVSKHTPLHIAAQFGYLHIVKFLVLKGADITMRTKIGETPLMVAKTSEHEDVIKYLTQMENIGDEYSEDSDDGVHCYVVEKW